MLRNLGKVGFLARVVEELVSPRDLKDTSETTRTTGIRLVFQFCAHSSVAVVSELDISF